MLELTNGAFSIGVIYFREVVCTLILEISLNKIFVIRWLGSSRGSKLYLLSHATVERIRQLGLEIYDVTRFLTISMSLLFPSLPTLAMRPRCKESMVEENYFTRSHLPGKSQNDRSATSFPLIWSETQLLEKVNSRASESGSSSPRN